MYLLFKLAKYQCLDFLYGIASLLALRTNSIACTPQIHQDCQEPQENFLTSKCLNYSIT